MSDDRLPTGLWVEGHLRQLNAKGVAHYVINTGAHSSGTVLLKLIHPGQACRLLSQQRNLEGEMGWVHALGQEEIEEADADAYIARTLDRDPDVWVIEIEDKDLLNPFEGKVFEF